MQGSRTFSIRRQPPSPTSMGRDCNMFVFSSSQTRHSEALVQRKSFCSTPHKVILSKGHLDPGCPCRMANTCQCVHLSVE